MAVIGGLGIYVIAGAVLGGVYFRYFPTMKGAGMSFFSVTVFLAYFVMCISPVAMEFWEDRKWKKLQSEI